VLQDVVITDFRCIQRASLEFDARLNCIVGANGSGKTSLLEALYFLVHGRSFRTGLRRPLIRSGTKEFSVVAHAARPSGSVALGVSASQGGLVCRFDGRPASSIAELATALPIYSVDPSVHRLIEEGSIRRRRALDWGVFHVKPSYLESWRAYQRALRQRNAALAENVALDPWEEEMSRLGTQLDEDRKHYIELLRPHFEEICTRLFGCRLDLIYKRGWSEGGDLASALRQSREGDLRIGTTRIGPHRGDIAFKFAGWGARDRVSRGQQKLLATAFIFAQIRELSDRLPEVTGVLLLDDPSAELDVDNLGKLLAAAKSLRCQLILTALQERDISGIGEGRVFHVKQGRVVPNAIISA
jgi:DNA replication and repair protein RecF